MITNSKYQRGFTLIEVLIALMITAVLMALIGPILRNATTTQRVIKQQRERFQSLENALLIIKRDVEHMVNRPPRDTAGNVTHPFEGGRTRLQFVTQAYNLGVTPATHVLASVTYTLEGNRLIRQSNTPIDANTKKLPARKTRQRLLDAISAIDWEYIFPNKRTHEYTVSARANPVHRNRLPTAIRLVLTHQQLGHIPYTLLILGKSNETDNTSRSW